MDCHRLNVIKPEGIDKTKMKLHNMVRPSTSDMAALIWSCGEEGQIITVVCGL